MAPCAKCGYELSGPTYDAPTGGQVCRDCHTDIAGDLAGFGACVGAGGGYTSVGVLGWVRGLLRKQPSR